MAEMAMGYGSEFQLMRMLGHHRNYLDNLIKGATKCNLDPKWMDYPVNLKRDSLDGELVGIEPFKGLSNYKDIEKAWKDYWPQRGTSQNWDAVFIQESTYYFVEAKANEEEAYQECGASSEESIKKITRAFEKTCGNPQLAKEWINSNCYQLANRLAFVHFCKMVGVDAKILYISFLNGYRVNTYKNVDSISVWEDVWKKQYETLKLTDKLKSDILHIYPDCEKIEF